MPLKSECNRERINGATSNPLSMSTQEIAAAGLDVLETEPPLSWELVNHPNVFATPHIAGTSKESNLAMGRAAIDGLIQNRDRLVS